MSESISKHPYLPYIPEGAVKLIIGSIPPQRFCIEGKRLEEGDTDFYYGAKRNLFWRILSEISGKDFKYDNSKEAVNERKSFLAKLGFGITDIIDVCIHKDGRAADEDLLDINSRQPLINLKNAKQIFNGTYKDIVKLLLENPSICHLFYTSEFVKEQCENHIFQKKHTELNRENRTYQIAINGKEYEASLLYSPSPIIRCHIQTQKRKEQYRKVFFGL